MFYRKRSQGFNAKVVEAIEIEINTALTTKAVLSR